ncbi:MAG: nucleotidyl transferase AbiEii/AbiGii toxin family protein [Bacteroidales bacterium]|nr:nucleotidyl transferase AbiEii/AbiGii toxin family protein [Bacteroidales bacterium]
MLLEGLSESKLDYVFKGGTALMLILNSTKRLSIDIDIIIPKRMKVFKEYCPKLLIIKGLLVLKNKSGKQLVE